MPSFEVNFLTQQQEICSQEATETALSDSAQRHTHISTPAYNNGWGQLSLTL